jgi:hypothetical protein
VGQDSSRDPFILLMGTLLLALASAIASALPAWNASQLDPMTALRSDEVHSPVRVNERLSPTSPHAANGSPDTSQAF